MEDLGLQINGTADVVCKQAQEESGFCEVSKYNNVITTF